MKISEWYKKYNGISLSMLRKKRISNEEWDEICKEYEKYCKSNNVKPDYNR